MSLRGEKNVFFQVDWILKFSLLFSDLAQKWPRRQAGYIWCNCLPLAVFTTNLLLEHGVSHSFSNGTPVVQPQLQSLTPTTNLTADLSDDWHHRSAVNHCFANVLSRDPTAMQSPLNRASFCHSVGFGVNAALVSSLGCFGLKWLDKFCSYPQSPP